MNKYCDKFELHEFYISDKNTDIRYIHKKDLMADTNCGLVCTNINQWICKILNHFDKLQKPNIIRKDTDEFWDDKPTYNRKLK